MKYTIKTYLYYTFVYLASIVIINLYGGPLLQTFFIWITHSYDLGTAITVLLMRITVPVISFIAIYLYNTDNKEGKEKYLRELENSTFSVSEELSRMFHSRSFWGEILLVSGITLAEWIFHHIHYWLFWNIPLFFLFKIWMELHLHKKWFKDAPKYRTEINDDIKTEL